MYNTNKNTSGNTIDGLQSATSVESSPSTSPPNGNNILDECRRSYQVIKGSLLLYVIYIIAEICYWIGQTNYISEERLRIDANADHDSIDTDAYDDVEDTESYTFLFLASNIIFGVVLGIQFLFWQFIIAPEVLAEPSLKLTYGIFGKPSISKGKFQIIGIVCILITTIASILDLIGMIQYEEYYFDDDNYYAADTEDAEENERLLRMALWGSLWSASLWSIYFISLFWLYNKQSFRLIFASIIYIIHCILFAPHLENESNDWQNVADTYEFYATDARDRYNSESYTRGSIQYGLCAGSLYGMVGICGTIIILSIYLKYCMNRNDNGEGGIGESILVQPGILYKTLYILCGICLIIAIIIYLVTMSCLLKNYVGLGLLSSILPLVYGPIVIAYDIFSFTKCQK